MTGGETARQTIIVAIEGRDELTGKVKKAEKGIKRLTKVTDRQNKASKVTKKVTTQYDEMGNAIQRTTEKFKKNFDPVAKKTEAMQSSMRLLRANLLGVGLSFLFFGMAVRKFATDIIRGAVNAFNKIMESSELAGSSLQELGVWLEFIKFRLGETISNSLEPYRQKIVEIISDTADWIGKHEKLVAGLLVFALVLGTVMQVLGQFFLAALGWTMIKGLIVSVASKLAFLIPLLGIIGLVVASVVALWVTNFARFRDRVKAIWAAFKATVIAVFTNIKTIVSGIWETLMGFVKGDTERLRVGLLKIFAGLVAMMASLLMGVVVIIRNIFGFLIEGIAIKISDLIRYLTGILVGFMRTVAAFFSVIGQKGIAEKIRGFASALERTGEEMGARITGFVSARVDKDVGRAEALQAAVTNISININKIETADPTAFVNEVARLIKEEMDRNK